MRLFYIAFCLLFLAGLVYPLDLASTVPERARLAAEKPFAGVCPRALPPDGPITALRFYPEDTLWQITLGALQGIVNRERPRLWLGVDKPLRWLQFHYAGCTVEYADTKEELFERYKAEVKGLAIWDPSLDATANVALTYAGLEDVLPVTPEQAEQLAGYGWPVRYDFRGRWKDRIEAYTWAFEQLFPRCNSWALLHGNTGFDATQDEDQAGCRDYAVQHRLFCWHLAREPLDGEIDLTERILTSVAFNAMVVGDSHVGMSFAEPLFVGLCSTYACLHSHSGAGNLSVLSTVELPPEAFTQAQPPARPLEEDKIYVSFMISEEDNLGHLLGWSDPFKPSFYTDEPYRLWWNDPGRGSVPIGWAFGLLGQELAPSTIGHYYATATPNDCFMAGLGGICLGEPSEYGAAYPAQQDELLTEYIRLTGEYMAKQDMTVLNISGDLPTLKRFAEETPGLEGIFVGYGPKRGYDYERAQRLLGGQPVFFDLLDSVVGADRGLPLSEEYPRRATHFADRIRGLNIVQRPAFLYLWCVGWDWGPTPLKLLAEELGPEYVPVRPDHLCQLYAEWQAREQEAEAEVAFQTVAYDRSREGRYLAVQAWSPAGFSEPQLVELPLEGQPLVREAAKAGRLRLVSYSPDGKEGSELRYQLLKGNLAWVVPSQEGDRAHFCLYLDAEPEAGLTALVRQQQDDDAIFDTGQLRLRVPLGGEEGRAAVLEVATESGDWFGKGTGIGYNSRKLELTDFSVTEAAGPLVDDLTFRYQYSDGGVRVSKLRVVAGLPYALQTDTDDTFDLPSWNFDFAPGLAPDRFVTNTGAHQVSFGGAQSRGNLPDFRWATFAEGEGRTGGFLALDEDNWTGPGIVVWTLPGPSAFFEGYGGAPGTRSIALVALPRLAPERLDALARQLNTPVRLLVGPLEGADQ